MWHKCIHMRAASEGEESPRGLLQEVHPGNADRADGLLSFVWTATGDPLGNVSLLHRGASIASLEQRRKSGPLNISDSSFLFFPSFLPAHHL